MWSKVYPFIYTFGGLRPNGRPFTYSFRDWFFGERRTTLVIMALAGGWILGALVAWWIALVIGAGFVLGHLIWGGRRPGAS